MATKKEWKDKLKQLPPEELTALKEALGVGNDPDLQETVLELQAQVKKLMEQQPGATPPKSSGFFETFFN